MFTRKRSSLASFVVITLITLGCSSKAPPANLPAVYKVSGKVLDKAGQPVSGGTVQFESLATQGMTAIGEVGPDGTFQIRTMVDGHRLEGAVVGEQRVTYIPQMTQDQAGAVPVELPKKLDVKAQDNLDVTLQL